MSSDPQRGRIEGKIIFPSSTTNYPALRVAFVENAPDWWWSTQREATEMTYLPVDETTGQSLVLKNLTDAVSRLQAEQDSTKNKMADLEVELGQDKKVIAELQRNIIDLEQSKTAIADQERKMTLINTRLEEELGQNKIIIADQQKKIANLESQVRDLRELEESVENERVLQAQQWQRLWVDLDNVACGKDNEIKQIKNRIDEIKKSLDIQNATSDSQRQRLQGYDENVDNLRKEVIESGNVRSNWEHKIEQEVSTLKCNLGSQVKIEIARIDNKVASHSQEIMELKISKENSADDNQGKIGDNGDVLQMLGDKMLQVEQDLPKIRNAIVAQNEKISEHINKNNDAIVNLVLQFDSQIPQLNSEIDRLKSKLQEESLETQKPWNKVLENVRSGANNSNSKTSSGKSWKFWKSKMSVSEEATGDLKTKTDQLETSFSCMDEAIKSQALMMRSILRQIDQIKSEIKSQEQNLETESQKNDLRWDMLNNRTGQSETSNEAKTVKTIKKTSADTNDKPSNKNLSKIQDSSKKTLIESFPFVKPSSPPKKQIESTNLDWQKRAYVKVNVKPNPSSSKKSENEDSSEKTLTKDSGVYQSTPTQTEILPEIQHLSVKTSIESFPFPSPPKNPSTNLDWKKRIYVDITTKPNPCSSKKSENLSERQDSIKKPSIERSPNVKPSSSKHNQNPPETQDSRKKTSRESDDVYPSTSKQDYNPNSPKKAKEKTP